MTGVPNFIIGGAPRSGTTWLYELLSRHPEIYMARPARPEPKFFLVDDIYGRGFGYYLQTWFADCGDRRVAGEKSSNYLEGAPVADRIFCHLPGIKLIFLLREPAERAYSNYRWSCQNKLESEDFETALALEGDRETRVPPALRFARPHAYFSRGLYAQLLKPYFAKFPRANIFCLRYEDIDLDGAKLADSVHRFLGVAPRPTDANDLGVINSAETREPMPPAVAATLRARYVEPNRELAELLGPTFAMWADS